MEEAIRRGLKAALLHRHVRYLKWHFNQAAYERYGCPPYKRRPVYRNRTGDVSTSVLHTLHPLYKTGNTMDMALGTAYYTAHRKGENLITAYDTFRVPSYLNYIKRYGYDWQAELAATRKDESEMMQRVFGGVLERDVKQTDRQRRKIRI
jgi:hypothetical protein